MIKTNKKTNEDNDDDDDDDDDDEDKDGGRGYINVGMYVCVCYRGDIGMCMG